MKYLFRNGKEFKQTYCKAWSHPPPKLKSTLKSIPFRFSETKQKMPPKEHKQKFTLFKQRCLTPDFKQLHMLKFRKQSSRQMTKGELLSFKYKRFPFQWSLNFTLTIGHKRVVALQKESVMADLLYNFFVTFTMFPQVLACLMSHNIALFTCCMSLKSLTKTNGSCHKWVNNRVLRLIRYSKT